MFKHEEPVEHSPRQIHLLFQNDRQILPSPELLYLLLLLPALSCIFEVFFLFYASF
jgi:hypothetical protein